MIHRLQGSRRGSPGITISPDGLLLAASDELDNKVTLWNIYTGQELTKYLGHGKSVFQVAFAPDSRTIVSASADGTLIFWKVPEIEAVGKPTAPPKLAQFWDTLKGDDAKPAYQAIWDLRQTGDQAVDFIKTHVKPVVKVEAEKVQKQVADLDDPAFDTRKKAAAELNQLGELAEPALRKALEGEPSAEVRKQAQSLLAKLRFPAYQGETLRALRAVQVLERIGTPKAREVLGELAKGAEGAKLSRDAKAALERLNRRAAGK
jgi:HEAT repeat protein